MTGGYYHSRTSTPFLLKLLSGALAALLFLCAAPLPLASASQAGTRARADLKHEAARPPSAPSAHQSLASTLAERRLAARLSSKAKKPKAKIKKPDNNDFLEGTIQVKGTATAPDFTHYTLSSAPESDPENRHEIASSATPVEDDILGQWDTTSVEDGAYLLTLEVFNPEGPAANDQVRARVDNNPPSVSFSFPIDSQVVESPFEVSGTASDAFLAHWKLNRESVPPRLLSHLDGTAVNERTGEEAELTGSPEYRQARFSQGLHVAGGQGITYRRDGNMREGSGTTQMWVSPDWTGDDQANRVLLATRTEDPANPADCMRISKTAGAVTFTIYDAQGQERSCSVPVDAESLPAGVPFHLAATWDAGAITLSVNGFSSTEVTGEGTGVITDLRNRIFVGFYPGDPAAADATFDELSIYDYARPLSCIRADCFFDSPKNMGQAKEMVASGNEPVEDGPLATVTSTDSPAEALLLTLVAKDRMDRRVTDEEHVYLDNAAPVAEITLPAEGAQVEGAIDVTGTAFDMDLSAWSLSFKPGADPEDPQSWTQIASGNVAVWKSALTSWNTYTAPLGVNVLRLSVNDASGKLTTTDRLVTVIQTGPPVVEIATPADGRAVTSPCQVTGTVRDANLASWELSYEADNPSFLSHFDGSTTNERDGSSAVLTGSPTFTDGKFSQGLYIGAGDTVTYPTAGNVTRETGTVEMWAIPNWSGDNGGTHILFSTDTTAEPGYSNLIMLGQGKLSLIFYLMEDPSYYKMLSCPLDSSDITAGVPFHLGATWDYGEMKVYLNGASLPGVTQGSGTGLLAQLGERFFVGSSYIPGIGADAVIDEFAIWDEPRGPAQIAEDYLAGAPRPYVAGRQTIARGTAQVENAPLGSLQTELPAGDGLTLRLAATDQAGATLEDTALVKMDSDLPRAQIMSPAEGQLVYQDWPVQGSASDIDLQSAALYAKPGSEPEGPGDWSLIAQRSTPVFAGPLFTWDTRTFPEGPCCLRLEVRDANGKVSLADRLVEVNNHVPIAQITSPVQNGAAAQTCQITGTASGENFSSYTLDCRSTSGDVPGSWQTITQDCTEPVEDGLLGTWDTSGLTEGACELRLTVAGIPGMVITRTVNLFVDHTAPAALITSPEDGSQAGGLVAVRGTASDDHFGSYAVSCATEADPDNWHEVRRSSHPVSGGVLAWWDTEVLADGAYKLKLEATDSAGHSTLHVLSITVSNIGTYTIASIRSEPAGAMLAPGETADFMAVGTDEAGNDHAVAASFIVIGSVGTVDANGHFTAVTCGQGTLRLTYEALTYDAPISVVNRMGDTVLNADATWGPENNPWVIDGWVVVPRGIKLTILGGTVVKFMRGGIYVEGEIAQAAGFGSGIEFTSIADDGHCGDTNANGPSAGSPGDWAGVYCAWGSTPGLTTNVRFSYGGHYTNEDITGGRHITGGAAEYAVYSGSITLTGCQFADSAGYGLYSGAVTHVTGGSFTGNATVGCLITGAAGSAVEGAHFAGGQVGLFLNGCENARVQGNTFSSCGDAGLKTWNSNSLTASGNLATGCGEGLELEQASSVTASNNPSVTGCRTGIRINGVGSATLNGNGISSCQTGIEVRGNSGEVAASGNTLAACALGIETETGTGNITSEDNTFASCDLGIASAAGSGVLRNNTVTGGAGISVVSGGSYDCSDNTIECGGQASGYPTGISWQGDGQAMLSGNKITGAGDAFSIGSGGPAVKIESSQVSSCNRFLMSYGGQLEISGNQVQASSGILLVGGQGPGETAVLKANNITGGQTRVYYFDSLDVESNTLSEAASVCATDTYDVNVRTNIFNAGGVQVYGGHMAHIETNRFSDMPSAAVVCSTDSGGTIIDNLITGTGEVATGTAISMGNLGTVRANRVTRFASGLFHSNPMSAPGWGSSISNNTFIGLSNVTVTGTGMDLSSFAGSAGGNTVTGYGVGVRVGGPQGYPSLNGNVIKDNGGHVDQSGNWDPGIGLLCSGPDFLNARYNDWGDANGPALHGDGNYADEEFADIQPWTGQGHFYSRLNGRKRNSRYMGDPVNVTTGNFTQQQTDLSFAGTGPRIDVTRTYNTVAADEYSHIQDGPLGYGWSFTYSERVAPYLAGYPGEAMILGAQGDAMRYMPDPQDPDLYHPEDAADQGYAALRRNADGTWLLSWPSGQSHSYDAAGRIVLMSDANGNTLSVQRDQQGKATSVIDACGQRTDFSYQDGHISSVTDPAGRTLCYTYDLRGDLVSATDLNGGVTRYTYDSFHLMLTVTDPKGKTFVNNTFNALGRVVHQADSQGHATGYSCQDESAHRHTFTDARGNLSTYFDNKRLYITSETDPEGNTVHLDYDEAGNVTSRLDKLGNRTTYAYDEAGNLTTETFEPLEQVTTHTYDARGNRLSTTDPMGNTTTMTYDGRNNVLTETDPLGNTTSYTYDAAGRLLTTTDPRGFTTTNSYDAAGNLTSVTNPDGGITTNVYDAANRKTSTTDPEGNTTTFTYDQIGNLLTMTDAEGHTTTFTYDPDGNQTSSTDALGNTSTTAYDDMARVQSRTDALGNTTHYAYDEAGNLTEESDPLGNAVTHEYDSLGREWRTTDAKGNQSTKTFDAEGNVLTETDAVGNTTTSTYDAAGKLLTATDPLGNTTTHYYDANGQETQVTDPLGHTTGSAYDAAGRLRASVDAFALATTYSYDAAGNRVSETDPEGHTTTHTFDPMGRETSTTDAAGRTVSFTNDKNGKKTSTTDGLGATSAFTYTPLGLIQSATDPVGSSVTYSYDDAGRRVSTTDPAGGVTTYAYDAAYRVTSETNPLGQTKTYTYDAAGKPLTKTDGEGTSSVSYDENGNVTQSTYPGELTESATYDGLN